MGELQNMELGEYLGIRHLGQMGIHRCTEYEDGNTQTGALAEDMCKLASN